MVDLHDYGAGPHKEHQQRLRTVDREHDLGREQRAQVGAHIELLDMQPRVGRAAAAERVAELVGIEQQSVGSALEERHMDSPHLCY